MKSTYKIIVEVANREALADIIDAVQGKAIGIEIGTVVPVAASAFGVDRPTRIPRVRKERRTKRGSKVNAAILGAMNAGPASIQALKAALSQAGMAPSSLSTGLAMLTKSGQVERVDEGLYGLKVAKAAE